MGQHLLETFNSSGTIVMGYCQFEQHDLLSNVFILCCAHVQQWKQQREQTRRKCVPAEWMYSKDFKAKGVRLDNMRFDQVINYY